MQIGILLIMLGLILAGAGIRSELKNRLVIREGDSIHAQWAPKEWTYEDTGKRVKLLVLREEGEEE